ncbi:hypothetical protein BKA70DRAFT_215675 [Coprinopsis sp. MPI-PUGE-AT-0042]|nr:hypothetical protein BKA70DRAFT_215675 [Coprinopsis sp. MPI-PUGE-AT-0042]
MTSPLQPHIVVLPPIAPSSPGSGYTNQYSPGAAMPVYPQSPMHPRHQHHWSMYPGLQQRWPMFTPQQGAMMPPPSITPGYYPSPYTASFPQMMPFGSGGPGSWRPLLGWPSTTMVRPWTAGGVAQPMMIAGGQGYPTTYYPNYPVSTPYYSYPNPGPATVIVDSEHSSHRYHGHGQSHYGRYDGHSHHHEHDDDHHHHHG